MSFPELRGFALALRAGTLTVFVMTAAGCASLGGNDPRDPLEGYNRAIFSFNDKLDAYVLKPAAEGYRFVVPSPARTGVRNFFGNLEDIWIGVNNLLQGKIEESLTDMFRVIANTTFGLAGLVDAASDMGMTKHNEDFGQTLGRWGVPSGPYFVLPLFGPSTVRDSGALPIDLYASPARYLTGLASGGTETVLTYSTFALGTISRRAALLDATNLFEEAALDRYSFARDAFFQRRRSLVYDGRPPKVEEPEEEPTNKPMEPLPQPQPRSESGPSGADSSRSAASADEAASAHNMRAAVAAYPQDSKDTLEH